MEHKVKSLLSFVSLVFLLFCKTLPANDLTPQEIAKKALDATVLLVMKDANGQILGFGSGFFLLPDYIATNYHVIEGATRGTAKLVGQGTAYTLDDFNAVDEKHDLAILHVPDANVRPLPLGNSDTVVVGDTCYVAGNPKGFLEGTFSQGIISSIRFEGMEKLLQLTAPISSGSSGGPVLNNKGEVIGVSVAQIRDGQNLNFAIPSNFLDAMLRYENGNAKYEQGVYQSAIEYYDTSIQLNPSNVLAYIRCSFAKHELGQHTVARQDCYTARKLISRRRIEIHLGIRNKNERQLAYEISEIDDAIRLTPNNPIAHFWRGFLRNDVAQHETAVADCNTAIRLLPDFALAYEGRAAARSGLGRFSDAIKDYDTAIQLKPDYDLFYNNRATVKLNLGQYADAIKDYDAVIQLKPTFAFSCYEAGE
ncbi:MAG: trypsin-like peptidase domain-containing protein [Candidatus Poribacteria bacterium]|nr:trypsin-like peptidase domain-containing protein [Candidatus Poribacteria bacterium]MDE0506541.1 trypsin-like peptidase domain-containing protein [Candidatus Poribacteria bacterium]